MHFFGDLRVHCSYGWQWWLNGLEQTTVHYTSKTQPFKWLGARKHDNKAWSIHQLEDFSPNDKSFRTLEVHVIFVKSLKNISSEKLEIFKKILLFSFWSVMMMIWFGLKNICNFDFFFIQCTITGNAIIKFWKKMVVFEKYPSDWIIFLLITKNFRI